MSVILLIAATDNELPHVPGTRRLRCGIGPVEAAVSSTWALARAAPAAVLHLGIAGAAATSGIEQLAVVVGTASVLCDLDPRLGATRIDADPKLVAAARRALPAARTEPIGTSASVGGSSGVPVEAMEGYAVLRAAQLAGVPALEVRVISNRVDEPDRSRWRSSEAFARLGEIAPALVAELERCVA